MVRHHYHYIVPVLLGPFTFLKLGKIHGKDFDRYRLLPDLTEVYLEVLQRFGDNLSTFAQLPVHALHVDATQSEGELKELIPGLGPDKVLSLGVVSGRNIWRND